MNVLYADGGGEERRRTGGGSTSESLERDGRAASTIHATTTTTTRRALEQEVAGVRIAHCSWCLAECAHAQVSEGFLLFRAAYRCGACARRTVPCRAPGCDAHARGANGSTAPRDDDLCLVHRAIIPAWPGLGGSDAGYDAWTKDRLAPKARCSWCLDVCRHALEHVDSFAPAVSSTSPASASSSSNGRSIVGTESFSCGGCARRTVRCETCERSIADGDARVGKRGLARKRARRHPPVSEDRHGQEKTAALRFEELRALLSHDEKNRVTVGDLVRIQECAPKSKTKCWELLEDT